MELHSEDSRDRVTSYVLWLWGKPPHCCLNSVSATEDYPHTATYGGRDSTAGGSPISPQSGEPDPMVQDDSARPHGLSQTS